MRAGEAGRAQDTGRAREKQVVRTGDVHLVRYLLILSRTWQDGGKMEAGRARRRGRSRAQGDRLRVQERQVASAGEAGRARAGEIPGRRGIAGEVDCKEEHCVGRSRREKVEGPSREEGGVCPDLRSTALLCKKVF